MYATISTLVEAAMIVLYRAGYESCSRGAVKAMIDYGAPYGRTVIIPTHNSVSTYCRREAGKDGAPHKRVSNGYYALKSEPTAADVRRARKMLPRWAEALPMATS